MADDPAAPKPELHLPHTRANQFTHIAADGFMNAIVGDKVVLTFYVNDAVVVSENMKLQTSGPTGAVYQPAGVEERHQRLELVSIRIPVSEFLAGADLVRQRFRAVTTATSTSKQ